MKSEGPCAAGGWDRALRYPAYALIALAIISGFFFVHAFGVNLLWFDDWANMLVLSDYTDGTLTAARFWELHNEHRIVFPKLAMFGLGLLTSGNVVVNMYVTEVLLAAILAIFVVAFRRQFRRPGRCG